ncbi:MAG: PhoH-like ATPase [Bradymonadia bacterium]|jgi:PhoH-like ATPase
MIKIFVLDTNVLLHEPNAMFRFGDNEVVLPIYVVEELDQFKKDQSNLGRNARECSRLLDGLRVNGRLSDGVELPEGGRLRVAFVREQAPDETIFARQHVYDNLILRCALEQQTDQPERQVFLITKDTNLRIRADAVGLVSQDYDPEQIEVSDLYEGHRELTVPAISVEQAYDGGADTEELGLELGPNEYVLLRDAGNPSHTALARHRDGRLVTLPKRREPVWGIFARNKEQTFALDLLLDDNIKLVTLIGKAGTGKTLLAIAAGLYAVTESERYQKVLVSRALFPLGKDIGFLPGTVEEKLDPWMKPIYDNVEFLMDMHQRAGRGGGRGHKELFELGLIQVEPITYIRGRSIPHQFMIIDEAQNLTPHEVKTILTRAGEGTKVVFTGDPYQIDNPYVDATNNGLVHVAHRFRDQKIAGSVTLTQGERSELAELSANLL